MKKKSLIVFLSVIVLGACGSSASNTSNPGETSSITTEIQESKIESISTDSAVESAIQASESLNEQVGKTEYTGVVENGVYVIEKCVTTEDILVVPDTISGAPVGIIKGNAFAEVPSKEIVLPDSVTVIGHGAFMYANNLEKIDLGTGLTTIGEGAFQGCPSLLSVSFPEGMTTFEGIVFQSDDKLGEVYIPASVTEIVSIGNPKNCPNLVVVTPSGSRAEEVAIEAGLPVKNV